MKIHHSPAHWLLVALVVFAFMLGLSEARGQTTGEPAKTGETRARKDVAFTPVREHSIAQDQRATVPKVKRAAKRTISRARHGVSPIDSVATTTGR